VRISARFALAGLILACGCRPDTSGLPATVPARGVVTLDGQPVEGAQVGFVPEGAGAIAAFASTDAGGRFSLRAFDQKDGAIPGAYKVQISKTIQTKLEGPAPSTLDGGEPVLLEFGVPAKYTSIETSGLSYTIPDKGTSDIKLELSSK
jgi:hypothetical protein